MDPTACLQRAEEALATKDRHEATCALLDLKDWMNAGGFTTPDILARYRDLRTWLRTGRKPNAMRTA